MDKELRVAAYCRVSTERDDQANSLVSQRTYFKEYISHHPGWILCGIYYDEGISGTQMAHRSGFRNMLQDAVNGGIDLILTKEVSRFARNTVDTLAVTRQLKAAGVGVFFTIDNIDTRDSDGELRLTIMASIAQEESRKISERVKWGQKRRMEQGVVFGRDLLGYTVRGGKLYVNEQETPVIRAVFHKYTNEGKGTTVIAREIQEEGFRPSHAKSWSNVAILKILRNEKYVGDLCQKKTITPDYLTHAKRYNHGEEEMVYLKDHHEPIIDRDLWERTQEELKRRSPGDAERAKHNNRYWYSGRIYCGVCGSRFVTRTKKRKDGSVYKGFRCGKAAKEGSRKLDETGRVTGCGNRQVSEEALLTCLEYVVKHISFDYEKLKKEILEELKVFQTDSFAEDEAGRLEKELLSFREKKLKAVDLAIKGMLSEEELRQQKQWYDGKIEVLQKRLEKAGENEKIRTGQRNTMEAYLQEVGEVLRLKQGKEWVFRELLDGIVIYEDCSLEIKFKGMEFSVHMDYAAHGKVENYTTEILGMKKYRSLEGQ